MVELLILMKAAPKVACNVALHSQGLTQHIMDYAMTF